MIGVIKIKLNRSVDEVLDYLKTNKVKIPPTKSTQRTEKFVWRKLNNPTNFRFISVSWEHIAPWKGICKLTSTDDGRNSNLRVYIIPHPIISVLIILILSLIIHAIITIGLANSGEPHFIISIAIPSLFIGLVLWAWIAKAQYVANNIKECIKESINNYITVI